ncbi:hypothetical protein Ancab_032235 [Ancistrocladus abbreviatus]
MLERGGILETLMDQILINLKEPIGFIDPRTLGKERNEAGLVLAVACSQSQVCEMAGSGYTILYRKKRLYYTAGYYGNFEKLRFQRNLNRCIKAETGALQEAVQMLALIENLKFACCWAGPGPRSDKPSLPMRLESF